MVYHLAQLNIAKLKAPIDHPDTVGFVSQIDGINAIADHSPGFVWRLIEEGTNSAVNISIFEDPMLIVNMSLWRSLEDLKNFVYKSGHLKVYQDKDKWFHALEKHYLVLWWVPEGEIPGPQQAKERLKWLQENGPSQNAFTFKDFFEPPTLR